LRFGERRRPVRIAGSSAIIDIAPNFDTKLPPSSIAALSPRTIISGEELERLLSGSVEAVAVLIVSSVAVAVLTVFSVTVVKATGFSLVAGTAIEDSVEILGLALFWLVSIGFFGLTTRVGDSSDDEDDGLVPKSVYNSAFLFGDIVSELGVFAFGSRLHPSGTAMPSIVGAESAVASDI
jgi:hypothetical protein